MKESQSRSYPEQQTKTIALRKNRGISWTSTRPYILPCNSLRHLAGVQTRRDGIILSFYDLCHRKKNLRNCSQSHCFVNLTPFTLLPFSLLPPSWMLKEAVSRLSSYNFVHKVNSHCCGHLRYRGLVSVMARVRNNGVGEKNRNNKRSYIYLYCLQNQLQCSFRI